MKRMMLLLVAAVVLFGGSAGLSLFMQKSAHKDGAGAADASKKGEKGLLTDKEKDSPGDKKGSALPSRILIKPTTDSLATFASSLRKREEALETRQSKIKTREDQFSLIASDIKSEQKIIEGLRQEFDVEKKLILKIMDDLERKAGDIEKSRTQLSDQATEIKQTLFQVESVEAKQIKKMASICDNMPPSDAGEMLQNMADNGKLDMAVKILASMQERQAAKVLAQMPERGTPVLILEKLKGLKKAPPMP